MTVVTWEPLRPVVASWCLEFQEAIAVAFFQDHGNEVNVIGSAVLEFASLAEALETLSKYPWHRRIESNILPPDPDAIFGAEFDLAERPYESAPDLPNIATVYLTRELFSMLNIDTAERPWIAGTNNFELIESINGYRVEKASEPQTFLPRNVHSWHVYLCRALEHYATWRHQGGAGVWRQRDYRLFHRGVI